MPDPAIWPLVPHGSRSSFTLVARFADFYQEVASIKQAQSEGRLAAYLAGEHPLPQSAADFASRVSARLLALLQQQQRQWQADANSEAGQLERQALYLMAALADEIMIFELDWPGRDAWLAVLLEQSLFGSSSAGSRFYVMARQLLRDNIRSPLHMDLAALFLLALELGFKGGLRARQGATELAAIRSQLYRLVKPDGAGQHAANEARGLAPAFPGAYAYPLRGQQDERLAPLSPWRNLGLYALGGYVLLSALVWLALMYPFQRYMNGW